MKRKYIVLLTMIGLALALFVSRPAFAQISLGTAQSFVFV